MFTNMYMAYDDLSEKMKEFLNDLHTWHESAHIYKGRYKEEVSQIKTFYVHLHFIL